MAEEDDSQKTEDPTGKKLAKGREKGQVAMSQEIKNWAVLLAGTLFLTGLAPMLMRDVKTMSEKFIASPEAMAMDFGNIHYLMSETVKELGFAMMPVLGLLFGFAIAASLAQVGFMWATDKLKFDPSKISLRTGAKRMFSARAVIEFLKGILKLSVVAAVGFGMTIPMLSDISLFPMYPVAALLERLYSTTVMLMLGALAVMTVIAAIDYAYQKYAFVKQMRMTKQEVKDEHKQSEGDPQVKRKIAQLRFERARQRMMAAVPNADVVITNPTHFAVALMYSMADMAAPRLVAKGVDEVAFRIRRVAEDNEVPIVENPPLARALYAAVELDEEIPPEHYKAVAEVIGYVMRMRGDLPPAPVSGPIS